MARRDALDMFLLSAVRGVSFLLIKLGGEAFPPLWKPLVLMAVFNNVLPWPCFAWGEQTSAALLRPSSTRPRRCTVFGALILLAAGLGYAGATALAKRTLGGLDPVGLATTQLPLCLLLAPVALGVLGMGVAYLLYYGLLMNAPRVSRPATPTL